MKWLILFALGACTPSEPQDVVVAPRALRAEIVDADGTKVNEFHRGGKKSGADRLFVIAHNPGDERMRNIDLTCDGLAGKVPMQRQSNLIFRANLERILPDILPHTAEGVGHLVCRVAGVGEHGTHYASWELKALIYP